MRGRMLRDTMVAAGVLFVLALFAGEALAHDPDWKPGDATSEEAPAPTGATNDAGEKDGEKKDEAEKWPDPFAEERKWGPVHLGAGAGYFVPWQGEGGHAVTGQVLVSSPSGHFRLGGEVLWRSYESRIFEVSDVDVDSYEVNFVFHYLFNPEGVSPYLGGVIGFNINKIRKTEVEGDRPLVDVKDDTGAGFGTALVAGLDIPIGDHFTLYGEARLGIAYQQTSSDDDRDYGYYDDYDDYDSEDLGGLTGVIGARYRF